jgi:hypothetical protein
MSELDEMSDAERHYFETGGDVKEGADLTAPPVPSTPEQPAPEQQGEQVAPPVPTPPEVDGEADDEPESPATQGEPKRGRRVSRKEFESERTARLNAEKQLTEDRVKAARVEERLSLLQQALQEPQTPQQQPQDARPDPEKDIFAYAGWLERQLNVVTSKVNNYEEQIVHGQAEMDNERRYFESLNTYAGEHQDFIHAYNHLLRSRAAELTARSYQVTPEHIQGIMDGRVRVPREIADAIKLEERDLYRNAFQTNQDPAATIYQYATMRGYRAPAAAPPAQAGTPGTPLGGQPAAPAAQPAPARSGGPTATDIIAGVQRGQPAAASLSKSGGTAPDTELTPEALANMSEERFAEVLNELQSRGDKTQLMRLFGA